MRKRMLQDVGSMVWESRSGRAGIQIQVYFTPKCFCFIYFLFFTDFIYLFIYLFVYLGEREHEWWEGERARESERERSRLPAQQGALCRAQSQNSEIMT